MGSEPGDRCFLGARLLVFCSPAWLCTRSSQRIAPCGQGCCLQISGVPGTDLSPLQGRAVLLLEPVLPAGKLGTISPAFLLALTPKPGLSYLLHQPGRCPKSSQAGSTPCSQREGGCFSVSAHANGKKLQKKKSRKRKNFVRRVPLNDDGTNDVLA